MNNKNIVSEHAKAIKRLNDELENQNLMRLKKLRVRKHEFGVKRPSKQTAERA